MTQPAYRGLLVTENPASSSPGLAFLLATVKHFGDPGYLDFWGSCAATALPVVDGWETAYYTNFSGSSGRGAQPMVVSYATSPAAEVMFAQTPLPNSPTASIIGPDTCFRQIEFVGHPERHGAAGPRQEIRGLHAQRRSFRPICPPQMFVYPVLPGITLPDAFTKYAQCRPSPPRLSPDEIARNRDAWIRGLDERGPALRSGAFDGS